MLKTKFNILYESVMNSLILENRKDDYLQQLKNKDIANAEEIADSLFALNNPKKEKCFLYWILKKSVVWPEDQDKMEQAFNVIEKQHLDFQDFERPMEVINRQESKKILAQDSDWTPDKELAFSNPVDVGNGIVTYDVSDDKAGQIATRKAIDVNWGYDKNPWCLAARKEGILRHNADEIESMSEEQKNQLGLYSNDELETAWGFWNRYNAYPKRIAFKDGKLLAFSANDELECTWWDKNDKKHDPEELGINDEKFIKKLVQFLIEKSKSENIDDREKVARNENTPVEILKVLANDKSEDVRIWVAENKNAPFEILKQLANDEDCTVRRYVAQNENAPFEILKTLAKDEDYIVRCRVARNKNTQVEVLEMLANDEDWNVRRSVTWNKNTPVDVLKKLANDKDAEVRYWVAKNENTPAEALKILANDENKTVREIAKKKNKLTNYG